MTRGTEGKCSMLPRLLSAYMGTIQKSQLVRAEEQCEGMVNAQLLWKQLNTLYITSDLLWSSSLFGFIPVNIVIP